MPEIDGVEFATALREWMVECGATVDDVARMAGVSRTSVASWLQGRRPGAMSVSRFVDAAGLDRHEWLRLAGHGEADEDLPVAARKLREAMLASHVTSVDLAHRLGVRFGAVHQWRLWGPPRARVAEVEAALGLEPGELARHLGRRERSARFRDPVAGTFDRRETPRELRERERWVVSAYEERAKLPADRLALMERIERMPSADRDLIERVIKRLAVAERRRRHG